MARRVKTTTVKEELPEVDKVINDDNITDFVIVLTKVYKINGGNKSFCFQTETPVDEPYIQSQYPSGGRFLVQEFNANGEQVNATHFDIEPKPMVATTNGNNNGADVRTQMLMEELNFSRQIMLQMIQGMFSKGNVQSATPVGELVQAVQGIHALAPGGKDPIDLLMKGMELGMKANGNGGGGDWKSDLMQTAKEVLPSAIQAFANVRQQQPMIEGQTPVIQSTPQTVIKTALQWAKGKIISGLEAELAVAWLIQNANDPQYQPLLATAIQGDLNALIAIDPELANEPYKTWFTTVIMMLKGWYAEQSGNAPDMDGGTGNDTDAATDASVSTRSNQIKKVV